MSKTSGPHNPDDVLIGFLDSPEVKALTALVAEAERAKTVADMFRRYIFGRAEAHGMMRDGKVTEEWRERVREDAEIIRANRRARSERQQKKTQTSKRKG